MPITALSIINGGLGKIAVPDISTIDPPKSSMEKHCANGYPKWRDSELQKRRWVFSLEIIPLSQSADPNLAMELPYKFALPTRVLRPLRSTYAKWQVRGRDVYNDAPDLTLETITRMDEALFDPAFIDVLEWRIAIECSRKGAQLASTSMADITQGYRMAIDEAKRANAFVIGTEDIQTADAHDSWLTGRIGYEIDG
jgi:hypothetical protein